MSPESTNLPKIAVLKDRALMLAKARGFFSDRCIVEVDCPLVSHFAAIDAHIDLLQAFYEQKKVCFLHSSPEYGMKRLIADGMGDIYQLSHVFRDGEWGQKHNPEFMMAEWYRIGMSFDAMMEETIDFTRLFLGPLTSHKITYREAFLRYTGIDYIAATCESLIEYLEVNHIDYTRIDITDKEVLLNLILGVKIEPKLGLDGICALYYYPANQAALAQTKIINEEAVAERFELYYKGMELANGYHELANANEQRKRLIHSNEERIRLGKAALPIDEAFLQALEKGLPDCCGVAVGFDRLMMLKHGKDNIEDVLAFGWASA